ncbi:hypothetical protein PMY38_10045 [Clostridium tertium]|uniref:hypothetical protein n=1 Tax=Clostridium TaxID=1485 RepID=UPI000C08A6AD|nr:MULTISPECIES: hypothetical protein [Clostridium]MDB1935100.1 hypothetical protein [Clostridium tertium]MDB1938445.1 hypothetical protein [Clostridium tertium]MDB1955383.1 hypothetical protein [Clostridium tertium]MDB1958939.1 hypothetical protein [Clostridium tertium]MDB1963815.1 hypothetical protein [Clostridium tertium]
MNKRKLIKNVRFDFLREGHIGCIHIEVDCETIEDLKEAVEFAQIASNLVPPVGEKTIPSIPRNI